MGGYFGLIGVKMYRLLVGMYRWRTRGRVSHVLKVGIGCHA